jgi:hypothetical protein
MIAPVCRNIRITPQTKGRFIGAIGGFFAFMAE